MKVIDKQQPHFDALWAKLLSNYINPSALLSQSHFDYRAQYLGSSLEKQICLLVAEGDHPLVGSCLEFVRDAYGHALLNAVDSPSALIVAEGLDHAQRTGAEALLRKRIGEIIQELDIRRLRFVDQLIDRGLSPLTHWAL